MYQLITTESDLSNLRLAEDSSLEEIIQFILKSERAVTLREIKRAGLNVSEKKIDIWIKQGIIERHNGTYQVCWPVIDLDMQHEYQKQWENIWSQVIPNLTVVPESERLYWIILALKKMMVGSDETLMIFESSELTESFKTYPLQSYVLKNETLSLGSLEPLIASENVLSLSRYFYYVNHDDLFTNQIVSQLYSKIGDVNPTYLIDKLTPKIRRLHKKRSVSPNKPDVFMETLQMLNYVSTQTDSYALNMHEISSDQMREFSSELTALLSPLINITEQHYLIACLECFKYYESEYPDFKVQKHYYFYEIS